VSAAAEAGEVVIALNAVEKHFGANRVLRGVDLSIRDGETFTILGGSGSGKSVCLKHMIGLLRPDAGRVTVFGTDITGLSERKLVPIRTGASMIFQSAALFDSLSVYENVAYPLREHHRWPEERIRDRVQECLAAVGLEGVDARLPAELSGGMRKRVGVARGIALEPRVILYDEPTTGLDPITANTINQLIRSLQRRLGVTSIVVTHDIHSAFTVGDRIAFLYDGKIRFAGTVEEARKGEEPLLRNFLQGGGYA